MDKSNTGLSAGHTQPNVEGEYSVSPTHLRLQVFEALSNSKPGWQKVHLMRVVL